MPWAAAFGWGAIIAVLGGLIGLGGAEFRLPVLAGVFKYRTLQAIVINLAISLVTVIFSFIFRTGLGNLDLITAHSDVILNILAGSLLGAYAGANFALRINERALTLVVVSFLLVLSFILIGHTFIEGLGSLSLPVWLHTIAGFAAGIVIGIFSSMLGVAGGEMIIPTIMLVFALSIKIAGTLSLAISIPTILIGLTKYYRQGKLHELRTERGFIGWMAAGSIVGALIGSSLLPFVPNALLHVLLGVILFVSALKLLSHGKA